MTRIELAKLLCHYGAPSVLNEKMVKKVFHCVTLGGIVRLMRAWNESTAYLWKIGARRHGAV